MEKVFINITDARMAKLAQMFEGKKFARQVVIYAPNVTVGVDSLDKIGTGSALILGKVSSDAEKEATSRNIEIFNMLKNEKFQAVNSRLTAEGALMLALEKLGKSVQDIRMLVMGFGRTGAAVSRLFSRLDSRLDIATNSSLRPAYAFAERVRPLSAFDFSEYDLVINTVPKQIVSDLEVLTFKKGAVYIDLASIPALNLDFARYVGADADIYPALPAKVCPESAAKAIYDFTMEVLND